MDRLSLILPKVLRKRGLQEHAEGALAVTRAEQWMTGRLPLLAGKIKVRSYKEHTLHIDCLHSVAVQECQGLIPELLQYLRTECAFLGTVDIRVSRS